MNANRVLALLRKPKVLAVVVPVAALLICAGAFSTNGDDPVDSAPTRPVTLPTALTSASHAPTQPVVTTPPITTTPPAVTRTTYVKGPIHVVGPDVYDLDRDGNGVACEH